MSCGCKQEIEFLKVRMTTAETRLSKLDGIDELVDLLKQVRTAMTAFIWIGNGFKWIVGVGIAIGVTYYAFKKWVSGV